MLTGTGPLRELDRLAQQTFGTGTWSRPTAMPMDAYRDDDTYVVAFDLAGLDLDAIELNVERNVAHGQGRAAAAAAQRPGRDAGRGPLGVFSRQLFLGDALDTDPIAATYDAGVLTLRIPRGAGEAAQDRDRRLCAAQADQR